MPDAGITEAIIIGGLLSAGSVVAGQVLKPKMPGVPDPGTKPGEVPNPNQAAADAEAVRKRALQRRTLDTLRVDPAAASAGIQVPS